MNQISSSLINEAEPGESRVDFVQKKLEEIFTSIKVDFLAEFGLDDNEKQDIQLIWG